MNEINLNEVVKYLLSKWKVIISASLFCSLAAVFVSLSLQEIYRSEALLRISETQANPSPQITTGYQDLISSYTGINLGSGNASSIKTPAYIIAKITSRSFFSHLASFPEIVEGIVAGKSFNSETGELILDESKFDSKNKKWLRIPRGSDLPGKPTIQETHEIFLQNLTINSDKRTMFISMSYDHASPFFAKQLLELIVKQANSLQMNQDLAQTKKELDYLTSLQANNKIVSVERSISMLMTSLIQDQMLANIKEEYLIEYIDQPYIPDTRIFPRRTIIVVTSSILSFFFIVFIMLFYRFVFTKSAKTQAVE